MSAKANYFSLGLFIILGTLALLASIVFLGVAKQFEERFQVETYFKDSVQGLDAGAEVKFRGVTVGTIERITFAGDVYDRPEDADFIEVFSFVRVRFGLDYEAFPGMSEAQIRARLTDAVEEGARMQIASAGLMGTAFLSVTLLDPAENPPMELPWTPKRFYIPSVPGAFGAMMASMEESLHNLAQVDFKVIADNLNTLMVDADKEIKDLHIAEVREHAIALLDQLGESNAELKRLLSKPELDQAVNDAGAAIAGIRKLIDDSRDDVEVAIGNLRSSTERIDALLADERINTIVQGLSDTSQQLPPAAAYARRSLQILQNILREQQQDIETLTYNLRRISEAFVEISEDAKSNPSRVLFGQPPPRKKPGE